LSKYDGHPNEKAHKKLASGIFSLIKNDIEKAALKKSNAVSLSLSKAG